MLLVTALAAGSVAAGESRPTSDDTTRGDIEDRPVVVGEDRPQRPGIDRPNRPERPLPPGMREQLERLQNARERHLRRQADLRRELRDATDEERAALRDQLQENRERWLAFQRDLRDRLRDRVKTMRDQLQDDLQDVVDDAQEQRPARSRGE